VDGKELSFVACTEVIMREVITVSVTTNKKLEQVKLALSPSPIMIEIARANSIHLLCLPAHLMHMFSSLSQVCHATNRVSGYSRCALAGEAWPCSFTPLVK
jgi:hypothetical protein